MRYLCLVVILLGFFSGIYASEFQRLKMVEERGIQNPDLYYNLGVTYWQTGQSGMATLYFLRALNLNSAHRPARENLDYAVNLSQDRELYPDRLFLVMAFLNAYDFMNLNRLAVLSLMLLILSAICLLWYVNFDPEKERALPGLILGILLVLLLTAVAFTGFKAYRLRNNKQAVLIESSAELRAEADVSSRRIAQIHEGIILEVRRTQDEWSRVSLPNGQTGWIQSDLLMRVKQPRRD